MGRRLAIVEDQGLIAHSLAAALDDRGHEARVIEASGGEQDLLDAMEGLAPDLTLLDLDLGEHIDAIALIPHLVAANVPVLMVTGVQDPIRRATCVAAGAIGVVDKSSSFDGLLDAIERVAETGSLLSKHEREEHLAALRAYQRSERERLAPFEELSRTEAEVLGELMRGRSVTQIARRRFVSRDTVRTQLRAIRTKLGVSSQLEAITLARDVGWQPPERDG